jgi:hypothetical protein
VSALEFSAGGTAMLIVVPQLAPYSVVCVNVEFRVSILPDPVFVEVSPSP